MNLETQQHIDYHRIAEAIAYLKANHKLQPSLEETAAHVHLSAFHFQRMFKEWAGVTPKQFVHYLSVSYAKSLLKDQQATLFDAAYQTGLSGTGRLHDLFVKIEGMTPGEFKNGGAALNINYNLYDGPFGRLIVASTTKGVCHLAFADQEEIHALEDLKTRFPQATYARAEDSYQLHALAIFNRDWNNLPKLKLHLKGTPFQLKVWEALLQIPTGALTTYAQIATQLDNPKACRAVGSAVGDNPIAFLIPCHRVIKSTGETGQYHWGSKRKTAMNGWEAASVECFVS